MDHNFDWQGKRRDQVESSYKIIWYSTFIYAAAALVAWVISLF